MTLLHRLILIFLVLLGIQAITLSVTRSMTPRGMELPETDLAEMPLQFGNWKCSEPGERDADAEDVAGAAASMIRVYQNANERTAISAYTAIWTWYLDDVRHVPTDCYPGTGHQILGSQEIQLKGPDGSPARASLLRLERENIRVHVLYWYQLGDATVYTREQMREVLWQHRGERNWPPQVKVMLTARGVDTPTARRLLTDLGTQILGWTLAEL